MADDKKYLDKAGLTELFKQVLTRIDAQDAALKDSLADVAKNGKASSVVVDAIDGLKATDAQAAIKEVLDKINSNETAGKVSVSKADGGEADSFTARYTIKQGEAEVGTIDIAKDMVATSGQLVHPTADAPITVDGQSVTDGAYIEMVIANGTPFYINVADLIEYNSVADTDEITLTDTNHTITATIKAISGAKLTDGTVTKAKLDTTVQASLDKADSALQAADKTELEGKITTAQNAADAAQADVDALEGVVGTAKTETEASTGIFKTIDDAVSAQATKDKGQDDRLNALETAVGEGGSVSNQISDAIDKLDTTDVATAVVDTTAGSTKVALYGVKEENGVIAQGEKIADVDKAGTAAAVESAIRGNAETDLATTETLAGHRKAIAALEANVGTTSVGDQIDAKIADLDVAALATAKVNDTDSTKLDIYQVSETDGKIALGDVAASADAAGTALGLYNQISALTTDDISGAWTDALAKYNSKEQA